MTIRWKKRQGALGDQWFLYEVFIKVNGKLHYLWCAVDQDGCELDILVTNKRDNKAAIRFLKKLFMGQVQQPRRIVTDKLRSYQAALRDVNYTDTEHMTKQYANNIAELSHQKTRQHQRQMRQFKSVGQAQRFLACHGQINNHFRQQRHLLKAGHYRTLRDRAFESWSQVSTVQRLEMAS